jgi:hypothetical protein
MEMKRRKTPLRDSAIILPSQVSVGLSIEEVGDRAEALG